MVDIKFSLGLLEDISDKEFSNNLLEILNFIKNYKSSNIRDITLNLDGGDYFSLNNFKFSHLINSLRDLAELNPTIVITANINNKSAKDYLNLIKNIGLNYNLRFYIKYQTDLYTLMNIDLIERINFVKENLGLLDLELDLTSYFHIVSPTLVVDRVESLGITHIDFKISKNEWKESIEWIKNFQNNSYDKNYMIYNLFKTVKNIKNTDEYSLEQKKEIIYNELENNIYINIDKSIFFLGYGVIENNIVYQYNNKLNIKSTKQDFIKEINKITQKIIINYFKDINCIECEFANTCMLAGGLLIKESLPYANIKDVNECTINMKNLYMNIKRNLGRGRIEYITGIEENINPRYSTYNYPENYT